MFFLGVRARLRSKRGELVRLLEVLACLGCAGCVTGPSHHVAARAEPGASGPMRRDATSAPGGLAWQARTASPEPGTGGDRLSFCGEPDGGLERAALRLARREAAGEPMPDAVELAFLLRAAGSPYVWPHEWTLSDRVLDAADEAARFRRFLEGLPRTGVRRCGIARTRSASGDEVVAALVADALADLAPVTTRGRVGQWLRVDAKMLVPATGAKLVVLGPLGPPRSTPTTVHDDRVEATFALDHAGAFVVQLIASVEGGPRQILEARVFADAEPPLDPTYAAAPGEAAGASAPSGEEALARMIDAARDTEGLGHLGRSTRLDRIARDHAAAMRRAGRLAHDVGDGSPPERLRRQGLVASYSGENVAHEKSAVRAHRALWASPSHRENLLNPHFTALGVGVAPDPDGSLWICELFSDFADAGIISSWSVPRSFGRDRRTSAFKPR